MSFDSDAEDNIIGNGDEKDECVPPVADGKSEEVFEVKSITDHMLSTEGVLLKVRWEGYGSDDDSWEPESDLIESASEAVAEYMSLLTDDKKKEIDKFKKSLEKNSKKKEPKKSKKSSKNTKKSNQIKKIEKKSKELIVEEDDDDDQEYDSSNNIENESDFSDSERKTKRGMKRRRSNNSADNVSKKSRTEKNSVPTKAALKSYDTPSSAKKAAMKHRQDWLNDSDSSDNDRGNEPTFDDKIRAKVKPKHNASTEVVGLKKNIEEKTSNSISRSSQSNEYSIIDNATADEVASSTKKSLEADNNWIIKGICRLKDSSKMVLLENKNTGEKKAVSPTEAHELASWNLCSYLLDRCVF